MLQSVCARYILPLVLLLVWRPVSLFAGDTADSDAGPSPVPLFERDVVPILNAYCVHCHGWVYRKAGLDLRSLPLLLKGGKTGPAIERGSAEHSLLFQKMSSGEMPPTGKIKQELSGKDFIVANVVPTKEHLNTIAAWIDAGGPARYEGGPVTAKQAPPLSDQDRQWWAFQKKVRPPVPGPVDRRPVEPAAAWQRTRTPIDAFLLAKLAAKGLQLNADAAQTTLVRRTRLDVIGIPPSPADVDAYLADSSPVKYERWLDRLLAAPHYGERWARHWLDGAGYSEIRGREFGGGPAFYAEGIWRYRDYVIQSWNNDKPYDRFLKEQLAGDELVDWRDAEVFTTEIKEALVATGFMRLAADITAPNNNGDLDAGPIRNQVINDTMEIVGTHVLGLTLQCAQCHSHKYEPISQLDYYRIRGLLSPAFDFQNWIDYVHRFQYEVSDKQHTQIKTANAAIDTRISELNQQLSDLRAKFKPLAEASKWKQIPDSIRADVKVAIGLAEDKRNDAQKSLVEKFAPLLDVKTEDVDAVLDEPARQQLEEIQAKVSVLPDEKGSPGGKILALWDVGSPPPQYIFRRGQFADPGAIVNPGVIGVLDDPRQPFQLPPEDSFASSSGYRTAFANWVTNSDTAAGALTARVFANRVWQHYFGRGIVESSGNLGRSGNQPTHPELLNWLSADLMEGDWGIKRLHRLILTSTAYRQSSQASARPLNGAVDPQQVDPANHLFGRMPLKRLDAEIVRDAVLAVSGVLDRTPGGPPVPISPTSNGQVDVAEAKVYRWSLEKEAIYGDDLKIASPTGKFRRSVYLFARRNNRLTELAAFDQPVVNTNCTQRTSAATVQQTLAMLNGKFAQEQAELLADRVRTEAGDLQKAQVELAFRLVFSRSLTEREWKVAKKLLEQQKNIYVDANPDETLQQCDKRAFVDLCQMLLNTNEFLYVE